MSLICYHRYIILFQVIICASVLALAASSPQKPYAEPQEAPKPFAYQYSVADEISKANFQKSESQDASGNVQGQFVIALPDGRIQTTSYTADHQLGFIAEVSYEGEPVYPKEAPRPYGPAI